MKKACFLFLILSLVFSCRKNEKLINPKAQVQTNLSLPNDSGQSKFSIIIHGGAGTIMKKYMTPEKEAAYRQKLEEAIRIGHAILKNGGTSLDAVEKTINVLENSPLFNAGKGAVFTHEGTNEHDASIMDGKTLNAGASAGTSIVKNPITLARAIMEDSPHVMLSGSGAESFAQEQGLAIVDPHYFYTEKRYQALQKLKDKAISKSEFNIKDSFYNRDINDSKFGTVGCVALDKHGNLAAGTSTGGMTDKRWGRIGDSPIIGAGTYANNNTCAVSCTGWGEFFIRGVVAYDISALMEYKELTVQEATKEVIQSKLTKLGGTGGVIAIDKNGNLAMEFNTDGMYRATMNDKDDLYIGLYKN
ncbi:isoaspartyl peptidase/L-asparaginase family protein [Aestuariivivens sediminis]|uniref:isoaspartyl peptidase/L-asparaginase family protein n=1 Tax=Aestuariivivens sediminis TaxID=2913557 RepID=UPI001F589632|nr:isoaspartyl peptidase/L-asparaginase [Aestuariivivens sediminis]